VTPDNMVFYADMVAYLARRTSRGGVVPRRSVRILEDESPKFADANDLDICEILWWLLEGPANEPLSYVSL
jgi:hypothetical protein